MYNIISLESLCKEIIDCPHSTPKWQNEGIPVIRNYNLKDGKIDCTNLSFVSEEDYNERVKRAIPEESDIIISREAPMGVVGIIPEGFQCCLGQRLVLLKIDKSKCIPTYLLYSLMSEYVQLQIRRINRTGSIVSNLNISSLKELKILLHNFEEQSKIATILSSIDDKISLNNQINQELEAMAKTLYDYWFVQFDFPDENGKPYKTSGGKMVYNEVLKREIPEGWEVKSLGEIEPNIITGKTPTTKDENNFNGNILFITIDDIRQNLFIYNSERTLSEKGANTQRAKFLKKGDICVSCIGTVGVIGIVGKIAQTNQQINSISNPQNFNKYFLLNYLDRYFKDNFTAKKGAVLDNMNKAEFESIIIINPIQNIKEIYYGKVKFLYKKIDTNIQQIQHLQFLRDWLLPMLMNGQISVE